MSPIWQALLVYALVLWCAWRLLKKYAANSMWQWQAKLSYLFEIRSSPCLKHFGRLLRPALSIPQGCNSHCSSCKTCA